MKDETWKVTAITLEQQLAESRAILEAVEHAIYGNDVPDFMESFGVVMRAGDLRRQRDALVRRLDALTGAGDSQCGIVGRELVVRLVAEPVAETRTLAQIEQALTATTLEKAMHAHDFCSPQSSGFDEMRSVLMDAVRAAVLTGAGEETT